MSETPHQSPQKKKKVPVSPRVAYAEAFENEGFKRIAEQAEKGAGLFGGETKDIVQTADRARRVSKNAFELIETELDELRGYVEVLEKNLSNVQEKLKEVEPKAQLADDLSLLLQKLLALRK